MTTGEHLKLLRVLHFANAGLQLLSMLVVVVLLIVSLAAGRGPVLAGIWLFVAGLTGAMFVVNLMAAMRLPTGGRKLSIVAACLSLPSAPVGTAFGIYALLTHFKFVPEST